MNLFARVTVYLLDSKYHWPGLLIGTIANKVVGLGDYDRLIQKLRQEKGFPVFEELRDREGKLKVAKTSFRESLRKLLELIKGQE